MLGDLLLPAALGLASAHLARAAPLARSHGVPGPNSLSTDLAILTHNDLYGGCCCRALAGA